MAQNEIARVSQLTMRTNQFNFTTIRRSEGELIPLKLTGKTIRTVKVKDKFGDYGLVGVLIYQMKDESLDVETFLLSCRVLEGDLDRMISF